MAGQFENGSFRIQLTGTGKGVAAGDVGSALNPEGEALAITGATLYISTASTGASTLDIGVAANATTSNDTLIDGRSGATIGVYGTLGDAGTNGGEALWAADGYVTVSEASGDVTGLVGWLLLDYKRLDFTAAS